MAALVYIIRRVQKCLELSNFAPNCNKFSGGGPPDPPFNTNLMQIDNKSNIISLPLSTIPYYHYPYLWPSSFFFFFFAFLEKSLCPPLFGAELRHCTCISEPPPPFLCLNKYIKISLKIFKHIINVLLVYKHSPTYKHDNYTKLMQIKHFTTYKSIEIGLKKHQND